MKRFLPLRSFTIGGNFAIDKIMSQAGFEIAKGLNDAQIVVFQGGEDVSPYLYGDETNPKTHCNPQRDQFEFACYKATLTKLKIGICRGAQFLNVMNGGWLWQHVDGHRRSHPMWYNYSNGKANISRFCEEVTSTHHQLIHPNKKTAAIWGTASQSGIREMGRTNPDGSITTMVLNGNHEKDVEICYYSNTKSLCFQPHPEYNSEETRKIFFDCVERALES